MNYITRHRLSLLTAMFGLFLTSAASNDGEISLSLQTPQSITLTPSAGTTGMQQRQVPDFSKLFVSGDIEVELISGDYPGYVEFESATDNTPTFSWKNGKLNIYGSSATFKVRITSNKLKEVSVSGCSMKAGKLAFDDSFVLKLLGNSTADIVSLSSPNTIEIEAYESAVLNVGSVKARKLRLESLKGGKFTVKGIDANLVDASSWNRSVITLSGICGQSSIEMVNEGIVEYSALREEADNKGTNQQSVKTGKTSGNAAASKKIGSGSVRKSRGNNSKKSVPVTQP